MGKVLYAPRKMQAPLNDGSFVMATGGFVVDVVNLESKTTHTTYTENQPTLVEIEVKVQFPRKGSTNWGVDRDTLAEQQIFDNFDDCLYYVDKLNKKAFSDIEENKQKGYSHLDLDTCKKVVDIEQKEADEYKDSVTFSA